MTIMCLSVWSVVALIIYSWLRLRLPASKKPAPSDREMLEGIRNMDLVQQIRLSTDPDPQLRLHAVAAMDGNRQERAIDALIARLEDEDGEVVAEALKILGNATDERATDAFLDRLHADGQIAFHPGLLRRKLGYGSDRLVHWLAERAMKGDAGAISAIGEYGSAQAIDVLLAMLQGDALYLWDRRRKEAAEQLARQYVSDAIDPALKARIEAVEGYVWMDSRGGTEDLGEENGEAVRMPVGRSLAYFIEALRPEAGATSRPDTPARSLNAGHEQ
jgi:hypothetical protein